MAPTDEGRGPGEDHGPEELGTGKVPASENNDHAVVKQEPPSGTLLSSYLTHSAHGPKEAALAATHPGMASIAELERGETCRRCVHWGELSKNLRDRWGVLKPATCKKYCSLMRAGEGLRDKSCVTPQRAPKVPPGACACRYFELNAWAPEMERRGE